MTTAICTSPDSAPTTTSLLERVLDGQSSNSSRSGSPSTRFGSPRMGDDIPYFTVARYRNPKAPITFELPAIPPYGCRPEIMEALSTIEDNDTSSTPPGFDEDFDNESLELSPVSPVELAFGKDSESRINPREFLGKSIDFKSFTGGSDCNTSRDEFQTSRDEVDRRSYTAASDASSPMAPSGQDRTPLGCIHVASGNYVRLGEESSHLHTLPKGPVKKHEKKVVRGSVNLPLSGLKPTGKKVKPQPKSGNRFHFQRAKTVPAGEETFKKTQRHRTSDPLICAKISAYQNHVNQSYSKESGIRPSDINCGVYEDARVTDAAEKLDSKPAKKSSNAPSSIPRSRSRETSFCLESEEENYPKTEAEYVALLQRKISEAHERQLLPLKEDLADWLSKLLGEEELMAENLIGKLDNGVIMCRLAGLISSKAQEARDKGSSALEVPRLPYRTWVRARSGTFFARDNITNFIRFCKRLGVHDNLLFETEGLVCGTGARGVVLCLLEVGRLAHMWWGLEPPGVIKLEKELDGEELSARSDSGYSNTSSPRDSALMFHQVINQTGTKAHKHGASPGLFTTKGKVVSSGPPTTRGPKPTPPPKPASITKAIYNIKKRPASFPSSRTYDRGWSGAKTTPTTPVPTPTHTPRTRLPMSQTPQSSGRSTPKTTPCTPTQCRRYLVSLKRKPTTVSSIDLRPIKTVVARSPSFCSRLHEAFTSNQEEEAISNRTDLDNKMQDIAGQIKGLCSCRDSDCQNQHIKRVADGTYDILGRNVFVRLLKGKHIMVRVGGGWDTLEHYLLRHDPTQVKLIKAKSAYDPTFLHIKSRYRSTPTPSETSPTTTMSDSLMKSKERNASGKSSPTDSLADRSLSEDNFQVLEKLEEMSPPDPGEDVEKSEGKSSQSNTDETYPSFMVLETPSSKPIKQTSEEDLSVFQCQHSDTCRLISAPMDEEGGFQLPPTSISSSSLEKMVASCPVLELQMSNNPTGPRCAEESEVAQEQQVSPLHVHVLNSTDSMEEMNLDITTKDLTQTSSQNKQTLL